MRRIAKPHESLVKRSRVGHKTQPRVMPKVKTHSGAKKRFKKTASGKFKFARVFKRHLLTGRSKKRKRQLRNAAYVPSAHHHQIDVLLPYA
jgi:large subunit ribosomal protein L35